MVVTTKATVRYYEVVACWFDSSEVFETTSTEEEAHRAVERYKKQKDKIGAPYNGFEIRECTVTGEIIDD
jgi:hypothetical protein